jgi:hypothetical protein
VWRVEDRAIEWFVWRGGQYEPLPSGDDGVRRSEVFPGLWLDTDALLASNMQRVLAVLQQGIDAPQHAEFVTALETRGKGLEPKTCSPRPA